VETTWDDLEYLKTKKLTAQFYQDIRDGVRLVKRGTTAYHAEYHQLYQYLNILSDDEICKMQQIDTIPEVCFTSHSLGRSFFVLWLNTTNK
jgi:hypothetical protein